MAGKKRTRGPSKYVKFAARALNIKLDEQTSELLAIFFSAAAEKKSREEISALLRAKLLGCVQSWVDEDFFDKSVFKLVGINVSADAEVDDDDEDDDGNGD